MTTTPDATTTADATATPSVLISGAGVAGMALAGLLTRDGFDVTVVERAPEVRESGYAVDFRGEALDVLEQLGLLEATRELTTHARGTTLVDAEGRPIDTLPAAAFGGDLEVPKAAFTRLLFQHTAGTVDYLFDDSITDLRQDEEGVDVTFEHAPARRFGLVFGADGVRSRVRRLAFGADAAFVGHLGMSGAGFSTENYLGLDHEGLLQSSPGAAIYVFNGQQPDRLSVSLSFGTDSAELDRAGRAAQEAAVREAFAGAGWEAPRLLAAMSRATDFYFASASQVDLDSWSDGRIALLGDAGYCAAPTSGMGTSQALLGARSLADQLAAADGDHQTAFDRYQAQLRPIVTENQAIGRAGAEAFGGSPTPSNE